MALFDDSDSTAQWESFRRYLASTAQSMAKVSECTLTAKLKTEVKLCFDSLYAHDLVGRAMALSKLVQGDMGVVKAASVAGLMTDDM